MEIPLPDDDPVAFGILLRILHAQNNFVPREVDLPLLTGISILVDKYQIHNAVGVFVERG